MAALPNPTRREVLKAGAALGATALTSGSLSSVSFARSKAAKCQSRLRDIEHFVILMQENRSFDSYFGTYPNVRGFDDKSNRDAFAQPGYSGPGAVDGHLLPFHLDGTQPIGQCVTDPTHSWIPQHQSRNGGRNNMFFSSHAPAEYDGAAAPTVMGYFRRADIPFYWGLADAFTLCESYHCSVLGPTEPNRLYSISAWLDPAGVAGGPSVKTNFDRNGLKGDFTWLTYPEQLSANGVSWKAYTGPGGQPDSPFPAFVQYRSDPGLNALGIKPVYPDDFAADMAAGALPAVSWIHLPFNESEHPTFPPARGEHGVNEVLQMIFQQPKIWRKTAVIINFDENGGFFDHIAPPVAPRGTKGEYITAPNVEGGPDGVGGIAGPIGLGFRTPTLIVSPWSRGGLIASETFDHTSVLQLLEARFGVEVPNLTSWRRKATGDLTSAFNFAAKPNFSIPNLPATSDSPPSATGGACDLFPPPPYPVPPKTAIPHQAKAKGKAKRPSGVC
ncbi:MAG TPA: alkaline phosphatase family protein [Solirubrobacteraceae bacterium]|nr:alkaline phosphatase family protein [Solirubrobacteraceae bacterium]